MDRNGIDTAILSLSAPGLAFAPSASVATLARETNHACAAIRDAHPRRFGFFATLPLNSDANSIQTTLTELAYALDTLHADGVTLLTSYAGTYLGHARFRPLWEELNRRRAVVFVHPTSPPTGAGGTRPDPGAGPGVPPPIIDFPHETTRAAVHMITGNVVRDFPDVKIILSHGGGTLPFVAARIAHLGADAGVLGGGGKSAEEFLREAKGFYFDLALTGFGGPVELVLGFAEEGHVLWGSDFPFAREGTVRKQLETVAVLEGGDRVRGLVESGAALRLFPRLAE
jgi:predicted TIM-barrel fold metal-dependent hydrolase